MYLINFTLLKNQELRNDNFGDYKFEDFFWFGGHHMMQKK
jgi:hypothetical protein